MGLKADKQALESLTLQHTPLKVACISIGAMGILFKIASCQNKLNSGVCVMLLLEMSSTRGGGITTELKKADPWAADSVW